jgi:hypothetical protein
MTFWCDFKILVFQSQITRKLLIDGNMLRNMSFDILFYNLDICLDSLLQMFLYNLRTQGKSGFREKNQSWTILFRTKRKFFKRLASPKYEF